MLTAAALAFLAWHDREIAAPAGNEKGRRGIPPDRPFIVIPAKAGTHFHSSSGRMTPAALAAIASIDSVSGSQLGVLASVVGGRRPCNNSAQ